MSILNKIIKKEDDKKEKKAPAKAAKTVKKAVKPKTVVARTKSGITPVHYHEIIKSPYISEKAFAGSSLGQYVFLVDGSANKSEIKKAIEKAYKVKVASVNITNAKPKPKRYRGYENVRSGFKKAVVTVAKGSTIDVMESVK